MLYLVTIRNKDIYFALGADRREEIMKENLAFVDKYRKAGKLRELYYTPDLKGAISVWDLSSSEDAARVNLDNPAWEYQDMAVQPLIDIDAANKVVMEAFAKRAKKK